MTLKVPEIFMGNVGDISTVNADDLLCASKIGWPTGTTVEQPSPQNLQLMSTIS